jgi:hypothetical protein
MTKVRVLIPFAWLVLCSCLDSAAKLPAQQEPHPVASPYADWPDPLAELPHGAQQNAALCQRGGDDRVRDMFCAGSVPTPTSLSELQAGLGVGTNDIVGFEGVATGRYTALAVAGHSTALGKRSVSAINPRVLAIQVLLQSLPSLEVQLVAVGFARGEQFVEIVTNDRAAKGLDFYLVGFRQACNARPQGCTPGELLSPAIESDWTDVSLYDETDLMNTVVDCAPCHQPDGPNTAKLLRMQELDNPWTHWFWDQSEGGRALRTDYFAAKGDETLAGMTSDQISKADPTALSTLVILPNPVQPNKFSSAQIEREVKESAAALGGTQPGDNSIPGVSPAWREVYELAKRGDAIPVPYHDVKVSDPAKLAALTEAYRAYRRGEVSAAQLPDLRDVFPDDAQRLAELGIGSEPGLDGQGVLLQACAQCHNPRLDPSLSRARFRADLQGLDRAEKDLAIARLMLPGGDPLAMPPALLHVLTTDARNQAIEALRQ